MDKILKEKISESRRILQNPYAYLNDKGNYDAVINQSNIAQNKHIRLSDIEIEKKAITLQRNMWRRRSQIWPVNTPSDPMSILDPVVALRFLGFDIQLLESLGQYSKNGKTMEVAGIINSSNHQVRISRQFEPVVRNFTAAHELGHAILHNAKGLHRDMPLDGSIKRGSREVVEIEADKFASYFLIPKKLLQPIFKQVYCSPCLSLNETTLFAFGSNISKELTRKTLTIRSLSRIIASAEYFNGKHFISLSKQFGVSVEAMAIRLEELELLKL